MPVTLHVVLRSEPHLLLWHRLLRHERLLIEGSHVLAMVLLEVLTLFIQAALGEEVVAGHEELRYFLTGPQHHLNIIVVRGLA